MPHTRRTIELSRTWDIDLTEAGRIPIRRDDIATAQDVANEIRRFVADTYFDHDIGIPHFNIELGHIPPDTILRSAIRAAARRVSDVVEIIDVSVDNFDPETRTLTGSITFRTTTTDALTLAL